jgi:predicted RNase H-like HicB family nuclease
VEWPEVITEGKTLEECRELLKDALREMVAAYDELKKPVPEAFCLMENILIEV